MTNCFALYNNDGAEQSDSTTFLDSLCPSIACLLLYISIFDMLFSDKLAICSSWFPGGPENKLSGRLQIRGLIKTTFIKAENPEGCERCHKSHEQTGFTLASHFPLILLKTDKVGCKAAAAVHK